jgi:chromosomal replication initiation ATPase DnaA
MQGAVMDDAKLQTVCQEDRITEKIARNIGAQKFKIWFERSVRISLSDDLLKVAAANLFIANWIERRFADQIKAAVKEVVGDEKKLLFTVDTAIELKSRPAPFETAAPDEKNAEIGRASCRERL